ncbi:MAG: hypothetical protein D6755_00095 [Anaerolineae bacterium]|nr:MAG: hypothetical protein D6755_00095 [Anaerolineae bacterium]
MNEETAHLNPHTPLKPAIEAWRIYLTDQGRSPHTIKAFTADVRMLAEYLPPAYPLGEVTTTDINNFLDWMQHKRGVPCSAKTLARRITSIKAFFRWLHQYGVVLANPAEKVVQRTVTSPLPTVLTPAEVDTVMQAAWAHMEGPRPDRRYFMLFNLLIHTGVKKSELRAIKVNHLALDAPEGAYLFVRYASPQHRYKERKIPLPPDWVSAYPLYAAQYHIEDVVFPWSQRRLEYLLEDLSKETGLEKHISFEMCRWTCALLDYLNGIEHDKIRQKLGISAIQWREVRNKLSRLAEGIRSPATQEDSPGRVRG